MSGKKPVDFFTLLFDECAKKHILDKTNRYAQHFLEQNAQFLKHHPQSRAHDWACRLMQQKEVDALLAILTAMGIVGYPTLR